jgi:hypothetical protein
MSGKIQMYYTIGENDNTLSQIGGIVSNDKYTIINNKKNEIEKMSSELYKLGQQNEKLIKQILTGNLMTDTLALTMKICNDLLSILSMANNIISLLNLDEQLLNERKKLILSMYQRIYEIIYLVLDEQKLQEYSNFKMNGGTLSTETDNESMADYLDNLLGYSLNTTGETNVSSNMETDIKSMSVVFEEQIKLEKNTKDSMKLTKSMLTNMLPSKKLDSLINKDNIMSLIENLIDVKISLIEYFVNLSKSIRKTKRLGRMSYHIKQIIADSIRIPLKDNIIDDHNNMINLKYTMNNNKLIFTYVDGDKSYDLYDQLYNIENLFNRELIFKFTNVNKTPNTILENEAQTVFTALSEYLGINDFTYNSNTKLYELKQIDKKTVSSIFSFNKSSKFDEDRANFIGKLFGLAINNNYTIPLNLDPLILFTMRTKNIKEFINKDNIGNLITITIEGFDKKLLNIEPYNCLTTDETKCKNIIYKIQNTYIHSFSNGFKNIIQEEQLNLIKDKSLKNFNIQLTHDTIYKFFKSVKFEKFENNRDIQLIKQIIRRHAINDEKYISMLKNFLTDKQNIIIELVDKYTPDNACDNVLKVELNECDDNTMGFTRNRAKGTMYISKSSLDEMREKPYISNLFNQLSSQIISIRNMHDMEQMVKSN